LVLPDGDDYPVVNGLPYNGGDDAVLTKLDVDGNIVYSTYLGRTDRPDSDEVPSVLRVENGMAYVTGITDPGGSGPGSSNDVFLFKINPDGSIAYLKLIGGDQDITSGGTIRDGRGDEDEVSMAISNGEVYLFGLTNAVDFPVTDGSSLASRDDDFFIMKLDNAGNTVYASYLGGSEDEDHLFINTTPPLQVVNGELYVFGLSRSIDFPTPNGNSIPSEDSYFVVAKFDAAGNQVFGTSFGTSRRGSNFPGSYIVQDGVIYIANRISGDATGYPVTDGIPAPTNGDNLVVTKLDANTGSLLFSSFIFGGQNNDNPGPADLQVEDGYMYVYGVVDENPLPTTNGSTPNGDNDVFIVKLDPSGKIVYSSYIGGSEEERYGIDDKYADVSQLQVENGNIYFITQTVSNDYPVTNSSTITDENRTIAITKLSFCSGYTPPPLTVTPATQTVCQFGLAAEIEAPPIVVPGGDLPTVFRNGAISEQDGIQVKYQWQSADDPNGPWTDIPAGILPGYLASVGGTDQYYRRKAYVPCCDVEYISEVAAILVNDNIAPEVSGDPVRFTCPDEPVTIGGSPTATEGSSPIASYLWDMDGFLDNAASPNPIATVMDQTIFTVTVTDQNSCQQIGQTVVLPVVAYAGPDVDACEGIGVRIGTLPPPGLTGVTYSWMPTAGLSCSNCAQPIASPSVATTYEVSMTIPLFGGGSCTTTDEVIVTPVASPRDNFAGDDKVVCLGETTELGTPQEDGFSYTWAPGNYLRRNDRAEVTFEAGNLSLPVPNPITYFVTAEKAGCTFVDQVQVSVIEADADIDGCGPRSIGTPDRTPNLNETYSWELVSGPGGFTGPTDVPVTSVSASVGGTSIYRLTVTLDGVECVDEVEVPDCGCQVDIEVSDPNNCPSFFTNGGDPITLTASAAPVFGDPDAFIYNWSPAAGLSTTIGRTVELTDNINRTYTVTMTSPFDPNFGCSETIEVNNPAWSLPVFDAQDGDICELNPTPVAIGQPVVAEYAYAWTGPNGFTSDMSNPSVTEAGAYTVTVTDIGSGCTVEDVATVNEVVVVADAGPDWEVCDNAIIQLGTPDLGLGYTYMWDPENSPWQNGTDETFDQPEVLITTDLTFTVTVTDPVTGCFSTDEVMVTVNNTPSLDPQPDATLCVGSNPVQIGGYPELPGVTYSWMPTNDLSCTDCPNPMASPDATTVYTVTATYPGQCQAAITDQITVNVEDISFDLGMDITYCPSDGPVNIGANAPMSGFTYSWDPRTDLSNRFIANPTASPSVPTTYSLTVRQRSAPFCSFTDEITVIPSQLPPDAGSDKTICLDGSTVLGNPNNTGTLEWSGPAASDLSCTVCSTPTFTPTSTGQFTFILTRMDNSCSTTDEVTIIVEELVLPAFPDAEAICQGACIEIGPEPEFGVTYVWSPQAGLEDPFSARTLACPDGPTTYTLTAINQLGCVATESVTVSFSEETAPTVTIPEVTLCLGSSTTLSPQVLPVGDYDYLWSPATGLDNPNVANPTVIGSAVGTFTYSLQVVDNNTGCSTTAEAKVNVIGADVLELIIDQSDCFGDFIQLDASIEGNISEAIWSASGNGSFSPSASDLTTTYILGDFDLARQSVIITLTGIGESCGNQVSRDVEIDLEDCAPAPKITCPADNFGLASECNPTLPAAATEFNLEAGGTPNPAWPTVSGGLGTLTLSSSDQISDVGCTRTVSRTYTITDSRGISDECIQTFTFTIDTDGPSFNEALPANMTVECDAVPTAAVLTASDNCTPVVEVDFIETRTNSPCLHTYTLTRVWSAEDDCGNPVSHTQVITVEDTQAPALVCSTVTVTMDDDLGNIILDDTDLMGVIAGTEDNCDADFTSFFSQLNFDCSDIDPATNQITVDVTAVDCAENEISCTVNLDVAPQELRYDFACVSELNVTLNEDCQAELLPSMVLTGDKICLDLFDFEIIVLDDNPNNGPIIDGCGTFQYTITETPVDFDAGLFETCWGYVNAEDKTAPNEVSTPDDVELPCVDFEEIMLTMLPSDINRCWEVERVEEDNDDTSNGLYTISQPGFVLVEGTMAPALKDRLDLIAGDVSSSDPNFSAGPAIVAEFSDGCAPRLQICVNDVATFGEDPGCDDIVITRTFTATELDNCENAAGEENGAATASFEITFKRPSIDDFVDEGVTELEVAHYECDEALDADANGNPIPRASDVPVWDFNGTGREIPLLVNADLCNIALTYEDGPRINTCPNTYKFVRTYTIIDWCKPVEVKTLTQVVKVGDTTAPDFTGPVQDNNFDGTIDGDGTEGSPLIFTTNAGDECAAYIRLDDPTIKLTDNCSAGIELKADIYPNEDTDGAPIGTFYLDLNDGDAEVAGPIPAGTHTLRYTYTDDCGNSDYTDLTFTVEDRTAPVAICEDGLNVSLTSGGTTAGPSTGVVVLTPDMVDKNSYDDCSDVTLKIGRVMQLANGTYELLPDTDYEHELLLDCSDLGTVLVGLEVTDEAGNVNYCWLEVLVEDKARPICFAPAPVTISCIEYNAELPADLSEATNDELDAAFGPATAVDNCGATVAQTITGDVNSCGVGQFTRTFTVTDAQGLTNAADCEQVIRVYGVHDYTLIFPTDAEADCMEDPVYDGVDFEERACDLITINTQIDTFPTQTTAADECFKLEITYDVINWCEYNSIGQAYLIPRDKEDGRRDVEQDELYLHVRPGEDSFDNLGDDDAWLSLFNEDGSAGPTYDPGFPQYDIELDNGDDLDGDDDDNGDDNIDEFEYAEDDSRGFFRYVQFVKIYDEEEPVVMVNEPTDCFAGIGDECVAEVTLSFTAMDDCSDVSVSVELDAEYKGTPTEFERTRFLTSSEVVDNGDGSYTVRLTDVPVGDHALRVRAGDGCGNFDVDILEFCVSADKAPTPICIQTMTVTLMPDGNGGGMAAIWATDFINSDVEDCFGNVIDKYSIYTEEEANESGFLPVVGRDGIELTCEDFGGDDVNVRVYAIDNNSNADYCAVVLEVQAFQEGLCEGSSGSLSGLIMTQDAELMAGVEVSLTGDNAVNETVTTAADGQYRFTNLAIESDYTVNPDYRASFDFGAVTVTDIVSITNHILGTNVLRTGYDHVAADVNLDADVNIFDLVAMRRVILGLQDELNDAGATWRFVEAGYNLTPGNWMATFPEVYNVNNLQGNVTEADFVVVELGNVVRSGGRAALELKVEDAELAAGQTHTIELTNGELAGFQGTLELAAGLELVNVSYEGEGAMNLNRAGEGLIAMAFNGPTAISLELRATEDLRLSEMIWMTDEITYREGTTASGGAGALNLHFETNFAPASAQNRLLQNTPNPVTETTIVRFELAQAGPATLTLRDAAGRVVLVRDLDAVAGANQLELTRSDLGASGVLSYTLTAGDFTASRKMVVLRR
jgi:hypothetical protein